MTPFSEIWWQLLILVICSYFLGNLNIALQISGSRKKVITKQGSGNPGAMNMYRNFGFIVGASTLIFDMLKGVIPVIAGWLLFRECGYGKLLWGWGEIAMFCAGFAAVLGHVYPVVQKFKGGKGVSTTLGVYFAACSIIYFWYVPLIAFIVAILYIFFFEWGSVGSLMMTTFIPIFEIVYYSFKEFSAGLLVIILLNAALMVLSYWKHRTNLKKLVQGRENRTVLKTIFQRKHRDKTSENPESKHESGDSNIKSHQIETK